MDVKNSMKVLGQRVKNLEILCLYLKRSHNMQSEITYSKASANKIKIFVSLI